MKTAVVLALERLPLRLPGCYGGDVATPNVDRLAADAMVFDRHFAADVDDRAAAHAWWTGRRQVSDADERPSATAGWWDALQTAGVEIVALAEPADSPALRCPIPECVSVAGTPGTERLLRDAAQRLGARSGPPSGDRLFWIQSAALPRPEGDPAEAYRRAAERVKTLDAALGPLREALDALHGTCGGETLFVLTAAQGADLGEQEQLPDDFRLPGDLRRLADAAVRAPLLAGVDGRQAGTRCRQLVQTLDLAPTLVAWFGANADGLDFDGTSLLPYVRGECAESPPREVLCYADDRRAFGIRTREFSLLVSPAALDADEPAADECRLFVKPDDVWDVHNVAAQEPEVVASLLQALRESLRDRGSGPL